MFVTHFGLRRRPFRTLPDTDGYYPATTHELALHDLERAVSEGEPICLLRGNTGLGKTLLVRRLLEQRDDETLRPVFLANAAFANRRDLLQTLLYEFELPYQGLGEHEARLAVAGECLKHYGTGGRTLLVIDEAHHLIAECLEELRMLGNLAGNNGPAVQIVLAALPSLWNRIDQTGMESLMQRLAVRPELHSLDESESADYVLHQLRWAGAKKPEKLFDADTLHLVTRHANGIPRLLNQVAGSALQLAAENGLDHVDYEAVSAAIGQLGLGDLEEAAAPETIRLHGAGEPDRPMMSAFDESEYDEPDIASTVSDTPAARANATSPSPAGKRVAFPPIVVTDTFPPKYIYDGDEWVSDPLASPAASMRVK